MKKINFIQKLVKEEKIVLVEPSEEICESYNQKSEEFIEKLDVFIGKLSEKEKENYKKKLKRTYFNIKW